MKNYLNFMEAKFVHSILALLFLVLVSANGFAGECVHDFNELDQSTSLYFDGVEVPLFKEHLVMPPNLSLVHAVSDKCPEILQYIIISTQDGCLLCVTDEREMLDAGIEFLDTGVQGDRSYRLMTVNGEFMLLIWNSEQALNIKDQNLKYLEYVLGLYITE